MILICFQHLKDDKITSFQAANSCPELARHCLAASSIFWLAMKSAEPTLSGKWPQKHSKAKTF